MADGNTLRPGYEVYYDRQFRVWVAYRVDTGNNQQGPCGYGMTKTAAKADCDYQNKIADRIPYRQRQHGANESRDVEQSEAFRRWFAGSKAVDADGRPLVVYHGTNQAFSSFDQSKLGSMTRAVSALGFFFTDNPEEASAYADAAANRVIFNQDAHDREVARLRKLAAAAERRRDFDEYERLSSEADDLEIQAVRAEPQGANVMPCYLRMLNPLDTQHDGAGINTGEVRDLIQQAHAGGHDGLIMRDVQDSPDDSITGTHYVVFSADQIKSATGNSGAFDPSSHDIGEASLVAFSPAHEPTNNPSNDMVDMMNATSSELPNIHSGGPDGVIGEEEICAEATPPGMEQWVRDRKAEFKKQYGKDWEERLYATAWSEYDKKHHKGEAKLPDGSDLGRMIAQVHAPKLHGCSARIYDNRDWDEYVVVPYEDDEIVPDADEHFDYSAVDRASKRQAYADAHAAACRHCGISLDHPGAAGGTARENQGDTLVGPPPIQKDGTDRNLQDDTAQRRNWKQFLSRAEFDKHIKELWPEASTDADEWSQKLATWNTPDGFVVGWWDNRAGQGEVRPVNESKTEGLGDADSPEAFIAALRAEAEDAHSAANDLAAAWQDDNAGRFWTEAGKGLENLADRLERWTRKNLYGKNR